MSALSDLTRRFKRELRTYQLVMAHDSTPRLARWLLGAAVGYVLLPFDIIPDFIPVIGQLDDLIIVPGLVWIALRLVPAAVVDECRQRAMVMTHNGG